MWAFVLIAQEQAGTQEAGDNQARILAQVDANKVRMCMPHLSLNHMKGCLLQGIPGLTSDHAMQAANRTWQRMARQNNINTAFKPPTQVDATAAARTQQLLRQNQQAAAASARISNTVRNAWSAYRHMID